jgi:hypothetical protein
MQFAARLNRLQRVFFRRDPADCPRPQTTVLLTPDQPAIRTGPPCRCCGGQHCVEVVEELVSSITPNPLTVHAGDSVG